MDKRVILITGGSRGLGANFVETLSSDEDNVIYYTHSRPLSGETAHDERVTPVLCDQRNENKIIECVRDILDKEGKIDALVNNACSSFRPLDFLTTDWDLFQDIIDVNVRGAYFFTREAARAMKERGGGKVINILSSYVLNVPPDKLSFYITAKYALMGLSKAAAAELCKYGITVNMISPGLMSTQLSEYLPQKYVELYAKKHPMKRMTTTSDAADVLKFLISDGADFINGVNIPINGGENF